MNAWCVHCDAAPAVYRDGTCSACRVYRRKYGTLPPDHVLRARVARQITRRLQNEIRCNPFATSST